MVERALFGVSTALAILLAAAIGSRPAPGKWARTLKTDLWLMNADGTGKLRITYVNEPGYAEYSGNRMIMSDNSWSPDGTKLVAGIMDATGGRRATRIVLIELEKALRRADADEVQSVLAHEAGHWKHAHVLKGFGLFVLGVIVGFALLRLGVGNKVLQGFFDFKGVSDLAIVPVLAFLLSAGGELLAPVSANISRSFEREADREALELTENAEAFLSCEKQLAEHNKSNLLRHPVVHWWYGSHPTTLERIEAGEEYARESNHRKR